MKKVYKINELYKTGNKIKCIDIWEYNKRNKYDYW